MTRPILLLAGLALSGPIGCLPVPFASPPIAASVGAALPAGIVLKPRRAMPTPTTPEFIMPLRVGAYPLALAEELQQRPYDFGIGYLFEWVEPVAPGLTFYHHGGYLEGGWFFLHEEPWRLQLSAMVEILVAKMAAKDAVNVGVGFSAQVSAEIFSFMVTPIHSSSSEVGYMGVWLGEIALGLYLGFSGRYFVDAAYCFGEVGLRVRLPASAGVAFVPLFD